MTDKNGTKNAIRCGICRSPADRHLHLYVCQANPSHLGDLVVGIFTDLTYPEDSESIAAVEEAGGSHERY